MGQPNFCPGRNDFCSAWLFHKLACRFQSRRGDDNVRGRRTRLVERRPITASARAKLINWNWIAARKRGGIAYKYASVVEPNCMAMDTYHSDMSSSSQETCLLVIVHEQRRRVAHSQELR